MSVNLSPVAGAAAQFLDNSGNVLTGGKLYTYAAGTTTPQATYTSSAGVTFHSNPIILDAAGRVPAGGEIWLSDNVSYKFVLKDANDVLIATWDNLTGINSNFVNYTVQEEIQTATAGQTVFTLSTMSYQPGTNSLSVYVDGVNQYDGISYAYVETDSTTVTFTAGLHVGALVKFTTAASLTGTGTNASVVIYDPPFTGGVATTVENKLAQYISVKDFGAVGDGITDDTTAFQNAYNACNANGSIIIPSGSYLISALSGTKNVLWISQGATDSTGSNVLDLPGILDTTFDKRVLIKQISTSASDISLIDINRVTSHTGGTPGNVNSTLRVKTQTGSGVANFEWSITAVLDNYATAGENVALYSQGNKHSQTGPTWAGVFEAKDHMASSASASGGLVGLEIDVFANGTDVSSNRIGIDIVAGRTDPLDTTCRITWGMRMLAQANNPANATYQGGILLNANMLTGIQIAGSMTRGIYLTGSSTVGIDFESGTFSSAAIRFGTSQKIGLEPTNSVIMEMPSATDLMLKLKNSGTEYVGFKIGVSNPGLYVNTIKVVGAQQAAIPNSGDATVNAILAALRTHGLIAT